MARNPHHPREEVHLGTIRKNQREYVVASLATFGNSPTPYLSLRTWYPSDASESGWAPGRQGLTLRADALPELMDALDAASRILDEPPPAPPERETAEVIDLASHRAGHGGWQGDNPEGAA